MFTFVVKDGLQTVNRILITLLEKLIAVSRKKRAIRDIKFPRKIVFIQKIISSSAKISYDKVCSV